MNSLGGPDLLLYLVLAFGGAMFVGNLLALVRPPAKRPVPKAVRKPTDRSANGPSSRPAKAPAIPTDGQSSSASTAPANPRSNPSKSNPAKADTKPGPKGPPKAAPLPQAPRGRTIAMMSVGGIASIWALATLLTK